MALLTAGSQYILDGVTHQIPSTEKILGLPVRWTKQKEVFFTKMKGLLTFLHRTCEQEGISYYLSCGTLLGAVKMQGFLPSDTDADVCVLQADIPRLLAALRQGPFNVVPFRYGYKLTVREFPFYPFVDIMPVALLPASLNPNPAPTYAFSYPLDAKGEPTFELRFFFNKKKHLASLIFPLRLYTFEGLQLWGPAQGEEVCRQNYGETCFTTSFTKPFRKHCLSGITATMGHRFCQWLGVC